ncbi:unnamed protein product, partial [Rotaria sordida]
MFYIICKYLSFVDVINLSKTCKKFYTLIENNDYFWMMLIQNHFGSRLYHRYFNEIFQNKKNSDYDLYRTEEDIQKFQKCFRRHLEWEMCNIWLWNVLNGKDNSDGYIAYKSIIRQKRRPRTNTLKMSLTIEEFYESYLNRNKYLNDENIRQISMCKLIYYYFIEAKRLLGVDLSGIDLRCTPCHRSCPMRKYLKQEYLNHEYDPNSSAGRCVRLYTTRWMDLSGIKADHGLDCECTREKMNFDWFESNYLLYGNTNWFNETMGTSAINNQSEEIVEEALNHACK